MSPKEREPSDLELSPFVEVLARQFIQRWDMYPRQLDSGQYVTIHEPLHTGLLFDHLRGSITLGTYILDKESKGRFFVLDADSEADWRRLIGIAEAFRDRGAGSYLERSRRGGHLFGFLPRPMQGREIRAFGRGLASYYGIDEVEFFPKQDEVGDGPGSLIRLPFGVHRKTGGRYGFYLTDGTPLAPSLRQQIMLFNAPETISYGLIDYFSTHELVVEKSPPEKPFEKPADRSPASGEMVPVSERIKAAVPVRQFILRYVELTPAGRGLCPFHEDEHPSLSVNDEKQYWNCFACGTGGSIIDFYRLYQEKVEGRECDFKTALKEMAEMLFPQS